MSAGCGYVYGDESFHSAANNFIDTQERVIASGSIRGAAEQFHGNDHAHNDDQTGTGFVYRLPNTTATGTPGTEVLPVASVFVDGS